MKMETAFFRSKVARRIFLLFVACAMLPITTLAVVTFLNMNHHLREQGQRELHQLSKATSMSIYERLLIIEAELKILSDNLEKEELLSLPAIDSHGEVDLSNRFKGICLETDDNQILPVFKHIHDMPALDPQEKEKTLGGVTLITTRSSEREQRRIFMSVRHKPEDTSQEILSAEISPGYLWYFGYEDSLPDNTELIVLDQTCNLIFSSRADGEKLAELMLSKRKEGALGQFEWKNRREAYLVSYRSLFMMGNFNSPDWIIVISKSKAEMLSPLTNFKLTFMPIILGTFWIVLFLSVGQIRRSMEPLGKLKEGTRRIAESDFDTHIEISSHDEFEDVGHSFNAMARKLGRQFNILTAMVDIDRAILSVLDRDKIINAVLPRMSQVFPCCGVGLSLLEPSEKSSLISHIWMTNPHFESLKEVTEIKVDDIRQLTGNPHTLTFSAGEEIPSYLSPMKDKQIGFFLLLPLIIQDNLHGVISLGFKNESALNPEDTHQARQLADQVAVALSNAKLIDELNQFSWGTLTALARAIDAKSPWTAGHSERVTKISLLIGKAFGNSSKELEILHRGALLHDIGKLGVKHEILDKPGELNEQERDAIQKHVLLGAIILEPIAAYKEILPLVMEHHENYDGSGYPFGLSGEDICLMARIIAVADRFEALTSNRPYRKALDRQSALRFIKQQVGKDFDPKVVGIFLQICQENIQL